MSQHDSEQAPSASSMVRAGEVAIAVAQFAPGEDKQANIDSIRDLATVAASRGAKLVLFPEYSSYFTAALGANTVAAAEPVDGPFATALAALAKVLGVHIVAGMLEAAPGGERAINTTLAFDPHGALVAT